MRGRFDAGVERRAVVRPRGCWPASTPTPSTGCVARSSPSPPRSSCGSCCSGSTSPPGPSARDGPASWPWSTSSRGSRSPPAPGRRPSSRPASRATSTAGSRTSACSGELVWGRLSPRPADAEDTPPAGIGHAVAGHAGHLRLREDLPWLLRAARGDARAVRARPRRGARRARRPADPGGHVPFRAPQRHRPPARRGGGRPVGPGGPGHRHRRRVPGRPLAALGPPGLEAAPAPRTAAARRGAAPGPDLARGRRGTVGAAAHGRPRRRRPTETLAEQVAGQLLARWGVVFWDLMARGEPGPAVARGGVGAAPARGPRCSSGAVAS